MKPFPKIAGAADAIRILAVSGKRFVSVFILADLPPPVKAAAAENHAKRTNMFPEYAYQNLSFEAL
jgi:hypothetical protein